MTAEQLTEYAYENFENPSKVLKDVVQQVIDKKGMIYNATFKEVVQMYSQLLEKLLTKYKE
jgi:hypothetical protein